MCTDFNVYGGFKISVEYEVDLMMWCPGLEVFKEDTSLTLH